MLGIFTQFYGKRFNAIQQGSLCALLNFMIFTIGENIKIRECLILSIIVGICVWGCCATSMRFQAFILGLQITIVLNIFGYLHLHNIGLVDTMGFWYCAINVLLVCINPTSILIHTPVIGASLIYAAYFFIIYPSSAIDHKQYLMILPIAFCGYLVQNLIRQVDSQAIELNELRQEV